MAGFRIGFNEGSLLRRTMLHVGTLVLGSVAFIGLLSFVLVSIAKGVVSPHAEGAADDEPEASASAGVVAPRAPRPGAVAKPLHGRRGASPTPAPAGKDE